MVAVTNGIGEATGRPATPAEDRRNPQVDWYRSPVTAGDLRRLMQRSDLRGWLQTGGYLSVVLGTAFAAIYSFARGPWWLTLLALCGHGTVSAFLINGVHELNHATVFATRRLNRFFVHVLAFTGWINHEVYHASHIRHHRYTLHPPADLEVVLPFTLTKRDFVRTGFINFSGFRATLTDTLRYARGRFGGEWELTLFPAAEPQLALPSIRWARILLFGHGSILVVSLLVGWWIIPVVVSLPRFYGGWLFFLCNNTQHIALEDNVPDFRKCCRSFTLNPLVGFLYWHMNFHTEHHMYAAVPCYNLSALHRLVRDDLPPTPHGIVAVWKEVGRAQRSVCTPQPVIT
jgi:fatty acid desaturase